MLRDYYIESFGGGMPPEHFQASGRAWNGIRIKWRQRVGVIRPPEAKMPGGFCQPSCVSKQTIYQQIICRNLA